MSSCNKTSTKIFTSSRIYLSAKGYFLPALTVFVKLCLPFIIYRVYSSYFHTVPQLLIVMCSQMFVILPAFNDLYWTFSCLVSAMSEFPKNQKG